MAAQRKKWPSVPISSGLPSYGSGCGKEGAEGAKNLWARTGSLKDVTICTYNVRSLLGEDRLYDLEKELGNITWDIVGLCEVRRRGEHLQQLKSGHLLYTGGKEESSIGGVGFLIHKTIASNVISYKSTSDRVSQIILKISKKQTMKIIQVYLPTSSHADEEVDMVYEEIAELLDEDKANFTIVMGDFNAKVGKREDNSEMMLGKFGIGTRNDRGDRLLEFASSRGLKVMNSFFKKKEYRKWTWQSPNGTTRNEIDFILTNRPDIITDVSVLNRFNTGSDHRLVRAKMHVNFKLERSKLIRKNASLNVDKLKHRKDEFQLQLRNRFQVLQDEVNQEDINDIYNKFSHTVQTCALKRENQTTDKITKETLDLMGKRRQMKVSTQKDSIEYTELCKTIRKRMKREIRSFNIKKVQETITNDSSYKATKRKLSSGKSQLIAIKGEDGSVIHDRDQIINHVKIFFQHLYSSKVHVDAPIIALDADEDITPVGVDEVAKALQEMKRGKAPGSDEVLVDVLKDGGDVILEQLAKLFTL
ncbi:uncharacterized protein LOC121421843 [Lytechinus variegatus]|uniref:uncharacterized protein LOC121421843 n=1 Tax=Lytechinus variegatus TaxID=7654 RepID=UPI001BB172C9|nr:uncharacterized protein LOC121421843 [Lytechinus variegatus]